MTADCYRCFDLLRKRIYRVYEINDYRVNVKSMTNIGYCFIDL